MAKKPNKMSISSIRENRAAAEPVKQAQPEVEAATAVESADSPTPIFSAEHRSLHGSISGFVIQNLKSEVSTLKAENKDQSKKLADLEETLQSSKQAQHINPKLIGASKWANRHDDSFALTEFNGPEGLKAEIESAGGNIQAIKVRPLPPGSEHQYEIVFGHRRHRACLELGLDVLAVVDAVSDQQLFIEMDRENRQRKDLRPFEQGQMYKRALDEGLFSSARKLAESSGVDVGSLGRSVALASLPADVINAFISPLDIQLRWSTDLTAAVKKNSDLVLANAKRLQSEEPRKQAKEVLVDLLNGVLVSSAPPLSKTNKFNVKGKNGQVCQISLDTSGKTVSLDLKNFDPDRIEAFKKLILEFIS